MRCAIYARVSTEEQTKNYSIPAQIELLRNFAKADNYRIFKEYIDEGISGTTSDRPQLKELFNDAEAGLFKIVLVYRIDRFFRNTRQLLNAVDRLQEIGVSFRSVTEPFDTSNPLGSFMVSLLGSVAQLERDTFTERTKMGKLRSVKEGHYMASRPLYGYKHNRETKKFEIDPQKSEFVKLIFEMYQEPHSSQIKVARKLNDMRHFGRGGTKWSRRQIHRILSHAGYCGKWRYTSGSESIVVNIPPLISEETFNKVQELLKKRRVYGDGNRKYDYLLLDYLYCGICKRRMTARTRNSTKKTGGRVYGPYFEQYYYCFGRDLKKECGMRWIRANRIDSLVWGKIKSYIKDPTLIKQVVEENYGKRQGKSASLRRELVKIANKIERIELEDDKIVRLYRKGIIDEDRLRSQMQEIKVEKQTLNQQKREIELQMENEEYLKIRLDTLEKFIEKVRSNIDGLAFEGKRKIIDLLVDKIFIKENGKIQLDMVIPDLSQTKAPSCP